MKRACNCLLCLLIKYKDLKTCLIRACGTTLNVINDANTEVCVPLLMARAAHAKDPVTWLKEHDPYLLDMLYDPWNLSLASWMIEHKFYRDQVTFHHAVFHRSKEYAQMLIKSGCTTVVIREGLIQKTHYIEDTQLFSNYELYSKLNLWDTYSGTFQLDQLSDVFTEIDHVKFVSWRTAKNKPQDMEEVYAREREWPIKLAKRRTFTRSLTSTNGYADIFYTTSNNMYTHLFYMPPIYPFDPFVETPNAIPKLENDEKNKEELAKLLKKPCKAQKKAQLRDKRAEQRFQRKRK